MYCGGKLPKERGEGFGEKAGKDSQPFFSRIKADIARCNARFSSLRDSMDFLVMFSTANAWNRVGYFALSTAAMWQARSMILLE